MLALILLFGSTVEPIFNDSMNRHRCYHERSPFFPLLELNANYFRDEEYYNHFPLLNNHNWIWKSGGGPKDRKEMLYNFAWENDIKHFTWQLLLTSIAWRFCTISLASLPLSASHKACCQASCVWQLTYHSQTRSRSLQETGKMEGWEEGWELSRGCL